MLNPLSKTKDMEIFTLKGIRRNWFYSINAIIFAFTLFSNFRDFIEFLGFFKDIIENWRETIRLFWGKLFELLNLNLDLNTHDLSLITLTALLFSQWSACHIQAVFTNIDFEKIGEPFEYLRAGLNPIFIVFLVTSMQLTLYQMSPDALAPLLVVASISLLPAAALWYIFLGNKVYQAKVIVQFGKNGTIFTYSLISVLILSIISYLSSFLEI